MDYPVDYPMMRDAKRNTQHAAYLRMMQHAYA